MPPPPGQPVTAGAGVNVYHCANPDGTNAVSAKVEGCSPINPDNAVLNGLGTVSSQFAICDMVSLAGWATDPSSAPPSGGSKLGSGLFLIALAKLSGSAPSR